MNAYYRREGKNKKCSIHLCLRDYRVSKIRLSVLNLRLIVSTNETLKRFKGEMIVKTIPSKKEQLVNTKTGEVVTSVAIIPEARDKNFVKVFKLMTTKVIEDLKTGIDGAIFTLWWFIDQIAEMETNQEPTIFADPKDIMNDLDISRATVFRHLKLLKEHGYIEQIKKGHHVYRVNPEMVFKGVLHKHFKRENAKKRRENAKRQEGDSNEK